MHDQSGARPKGSSSLGNNSWSRCFWLSDDVDCPADEAAPPWVFPGGVLAGGPLSALGVLSGLGATGPF